MLAGIRRMIRSRFFYHSVIIAAILIIGFTFSFLTYTMVVVPASRTCSIAYDNDTSDRVLAPVDPNTSLEQTLISAQDVYGVSLVLHKPDSSGTVSITLKDSSGGEILAETQKNFSEISDGQFNDFVFDHPIKITSEKHFILSVTSSDPSFGVFLTKSDQYKDGLLRISGKNQNNDLVFHILGERNHFLITFYWLIAGLAIAMLAATYVFIFILHWKIYNVYLFAALAIGILYMIVITPQAAPDEPQHFCTAYRYSNLFFGKPYAGKNNAVVMRECDLRFTDFSTAISKTTYKTEFDHFLSYNTNTQYVNFAGNDVRTFPFLYLFSSLGIAFARLLHLGFIPMFQIGRLFNFLFFILCTTMAIRIIPIGKKVFFVLFLLPMTVQLAASYNYDSLVLALSFIFIAACVAAIYKKGPLKSSLFVLLIVSGALLAPSKFAYIPLIFLCLLIPRERFSSFKRYLLSLSLIIGSALLTYLIVFHFYLPSSLTSSNNIIVWSDTPGFTAGYLISHPLHFVKLVCRTYNLNLDFYLQSLIGKDLGWFNIPIPIWLFIDFILLLFLSTVGSNETQVIQSRIHKIYFVFIFLSAFILINFALCIGWTPISSNIITGLQGRYFIPVLPLLLIPLQNARVTATKSIKGFVMFSCVLLQTVTVFYIFSCAAGR